MATILAFHAHPDDESVSTGVTLAKYADEVIELLLLQQLMVQLVKFITMKTQKSYFQNWLKCEKRNLKKV